MVAPASRRRFYEPSTLRQFTSDTPALRNVRFVTRNIFLTRMFSTENKFFDGSPLEFFLDFHSVHS
jgi:hypothetical protein